MSGKTRRSTHLALLHERVGRHGQRLGEGHELAALAERAAAPLHAPHVQAQAARQLRATPLYRCTAHFIRITYFYFLRDMNRMNTARRLGY